MPCSDPSHEATGVQAPLGVEPGKGVHIDPDCALDIYERLGAKNMVPVHWGTLHLRLGLPSMPSRRLAKIVGERNAAGVRILAHGDTLSLEPTA